MPANGAGGGTRDNAMLGYISKYSKCPRQRLEDHVMTDGNVLLQQHELVMNQLISEQSQIPLSALLHGSAVNKMGGGAFLDAFWVSIPTAFLLL